MSLNEVLALLQQRGIKIGLEGDQLKIRAAKEAMTADIKALLIENKAALLDWARGKTLEQQQSQPIPPRSSEQTTLPLSFSQQRLWFLEQLDPGSAAYHIPAAALLTGQLDVGVMNRVFAELITRHESLRTTFSSADGDTRQIVHAAMPFAIDCENFATDSSTNDGRHAITQRVMQEARAAFDLINGPLLRVSLLRLNPGSSDDIAQHLLLVTMHHIITDGWSINVMLGEIARLYVAFSLKQPSPLPALPIQYGDFACWQRTTLTDDQLKQRLAYWQQKLDNVPVLELPTDFTRPAVRRGVGAQYEFDIDAATLAALKIIAQQRGVTLFIVLMAAYYALLHRYTGQADVCVGTPIAGRTRAELQNLIGFFVNTLALRCDIAGNPTLDELISRVNNVMLEATTNQDVPFESVVESLALTRDMSTTPVFQAMLVLQNASIGNRFDGQRVDNQPLGNLKIEALASDSGASKFDITFNLHEAGNQLHVGIEYDTDLFGAARITRMGRHFTNMLRAFAHNPATRIGAIDYLDAGERAQILSLWNNTRTNYPKSVHLGAQFDAIAATTPHAIAIDFADQQISYGELNQQASQLAHHLRALGMTDFDNIAICLQRSVELITSVVAITKANGAYVPLDPDYPDDRLSFMLADTRARLIITTQQHAQRLRSLPLTQQTDTRSSATQLPPIICIDSDAASIAQCATHYASPQHNNNGEQLAYVMYTSGSTGLPKGVMVPQRGITRLVKNTHYIELGPNDATGHISNVSFDAATLEIWGALLNGGRIVGIDKDTLLDREKFKQVLQQKRVSAMFITVTLFNLYVAEDPSMFASVKNLLVGGEALDPNKIRAVLNANPPQRLLNGYGPTENTTFTCCYHITHLASDAKTVPLGFPLANTTTYVVDQYNQLTPIGIAGELVTGGDGVALGYLNRDDLNVQKFVNDPFANRSSANDSSTNNSSTNNATAKLYRTGDIVRWREDGSIEMLGRADDQVKIRGFRIELGEIDAALGALPSVRECAVIVRNDDDGNKLLAAYVVAHEHGEHSAIIQHIKQQLADVLPKFMLPHAWVVLDKLPLTANGKLDRRALPAPDWSAQTASEYVAPRNDTEQQLAQLWQDVLGVERIGVFDSFFELGGHSLLAARLVSQITEKFNKALPLRALFNEPTIAAVARALDEGGLDDSSAAIAPADRSQPLPLSFNQLRLWFVQQFGGGANVFNISTAVRIHGTLDTDALRASFEQVMQHHESLRTRFETRGDDVFQIIEPASALLLPVEALTLMAGENVEQAVGRVAASNAALPFNIATGPLWRVRLLQIGSDDHALVMCIHHIITDGLSLQMMLAEIGTRYAANIAHTDALIPASPVQYADFAAWQRDRLKDEKLLALLRYWEQQLGGAPTLLNLPTDRPRQPQQTFNGDLLTFTLDAELARDLKAFYRQHNATAYIVLLSALQLLLARYSGQNDICIGSAVSGRIRPELHNVLGFFANTVVMRGRLGDNPSVSELIDAVKDTVIGAFENQELPFEQLVDHLKVPRSTAHSPLYQVAFTMTQTSVASDQNLRRQFGDLQFEAIGNTSRAVQVDLTLSASEGDDGINCAFEFNTDLFDRSTVERLARHLQRILRTMISDAQRPIQAIELIERRELPALLQLDDTTLQHVAPLTSTLRDLYLAHVINPATEINSLGQYTIISHTVDVQKMRDAAQALVNTTDILRTRFVAGRHAFIDDVYMVVEHQRDVDFHVRDVSAEMSADAHTSDAQLRALIERLIYVPYDIHSTALYRFELLILSPTRCALVLIGNHILFDGVSSTSCLKQLLALYQNNCAATNPVATNPAATADNGFFDYIDTARQAFDTRDTIAFWRQRLASVEPLNFSKQHGETRTGFISLHDHIDRDHVARAQAFCDANGLTLPRYFRSLYGVLIQEYCRADADFIVRDTLAGRSAEHAQSLGCFHRLVPFVFEQSLFAAATPLPRLFAYNADYVQQVRAHSQISLVEQRRLTESANIGFMFNFYRFDYRVPFEGESVALEFLGPIAVDGQVQLILEQVDDILRLHLHYPAAIFDDLRLLQRLMQLSQQVLNGARTVGELSLLLPDEQTRLQQWSCATPLYPTQPVHRQFEQMAERHADRIAVCCDDTSLNYRELTYRELNTRANQLAHTLIDAGVGVGSFVGLCLDRSVDLMVALLGILKAGAAYVPLDPHFPSDRLQFITEDADCTLLVTSHDLQQHLPQFSGQRIFINDVSTTIATHNPTLAVTAADTIYVLYTSGTTGKPKGCLVTHANVSRLFSCTDDCFGFNERDVWTLFHSYAFDFTVWEMWGALLYGGKLVIVPHAVSRAPDRFYQLLIEQQVSVLNQTPSAFSQLIAIDADSTDHARLALRYVVFGGEALDFNALRTWRLHHDLASTRLINMYGITETTVHVTLYPVTDADLERGGSVIGKPISDLHTHIVNTRGQRQPIGIPGEILVAGPGVTNGYLKRDDLTLQRFVDNPFVAELAPAQQPFYQRLYRSGDLGRYGVDGNIEYLGRIDLQVKIRGHRIELGEIEHRLAQLEHVREAIVLVTGEAENKQLVGYLLSSHRELDLAQLRAQLSQQLPDYMIPAHFVVIAQWPLTPTGKVDKKALPAPDAALGNRAQYVAPSSDTEKNLAQIWEQLLAVTGIGIHDNFFFIGGHSLVAVKMVSRVREQLHVELPLTTVFEQPTIERLAMYIDSVIWAQQQTTDDTDTNNNDTATDEDREEFEI